MNTTLEAQYLTLNIAALCVTIPKSFFWILATEDEFYRQGHKVNHENSLNSSLNFTLSSREDTECIYTDK